VIAAIGMYLTFLNKQQSIIMAPTEILANQHYDTIRKLLSPFRIKIHLITSGTKSRKIGNWKLEIGNYDIVVGTHAVLYGKIKQKNVGFVVIDEQQRFGVEQRSTLRNLGENPHVLTMTATPIPRTVALTMYGDLDISFLDEMPKGRRKIKTWLVPPQKREGAYKWIEKEIMMHKSQVFIICPLIEESENLVSVKAVTKEYEWLKTKIFPKLKLGLLHGRMKAQEKNEALNNFKNKKFDILVSTPVVEVGIDISNAAIMLIEQSERFGLAQLHQLRGRVGRGDKQSYCLLFTSATQMKTIERLKSMEIIDFGPQLAELDLKLRGPGQIYGTLQHGIPALKVASFSDFDLIRKTRKVAEEIIDSLDKHPLLEQKILGIENKNISPD
jgi:ATP-dependent DNA helicase RecG